jgi:hypothetical protein
LANLYKNGKVTAIYKRRNKTRTKNTQDRKNKNTNIKRTLKNISRPPLT